MEFQRLEMHDSCRRTDLVATTGVAAKAHVQVWFAERLYQTHLLLHPDF